MARLFERLFPSAARAVELALTDPRTPIRSPWSSTSLSRVALADLEGLAPGEVQRSQAMKVPSVVRSRGLICGTLSRYPLSRWEGDTKLTPAPWMVSTNTGQSPRIRMLWTLDDMFFSGLGLWAVERGADGESGNITDALRVPPGQWNVQPDTGIVLVDGRPASTEEVILFEGPQEGLLTIADGAIVASRDMTRAWAARVEAPVPLIVVKQTDTALQLDEDEIDDMLDDFEKARRNGGSVFGPRGYEIDIEGDVKTDLFVEGRNAERIDFGNYANMPAAMLDGSLSTATLTYSTTEGKRSEFVDFSLAYWAMPIEARLSQDDVLPNGQDCRFDLQWLTTPTQPATNPGQED